MKVIGHGTEGDNGAVIDEDGVILASVNDERLRGMTPGNGWFEGMESKKAGSRKRSVETLARYRHFLPFSKLRNVALPGALAATVRVKQVTHELAAVDPRLTQVSLVRKLPEISPRFWKTGGRYDPERLTV